MKTVTKVQTRWAIHRDYPEMVGIEELCFDRPWTADEMRQKLAGRGTIGLVAEIRDRVVGYMIYELGKRDLNVINIAVHPDYQRRGIGAQLLQRLTSKLELSRRTAVYSPVSEYNVNAQLFFQSQGFRAVETLRGFYDQMDAYDFVYELT